MGLLRSSKPDVTALATRQVAAASITGEADCQRALVAYGDVNTVDTWSGIPYHFLQAGRRTGLFTAGVTLRPGRFRRRRILWNALRPLTLNRPRGFMYSRAHLHALWADRRAPSGIGEYVSHIQSLPPRESVREPVSYYIDATMRQYFEDYERSLGRRIKAEVLAREKEAYEAARFVVCMSRWCAEDVKASYGISPEKVRVILPGANIDDASVPAPAGWDGTLAPLRLGFIGIDWERKGGPVLLDAATRLQRMGHSVEVVVIGPDASELPEHPALRPMGFIHKARDLPRFVEVVRSFHFGCLLSHAEALGISTLECLRLGVPVIATAVGGIVDTVPRGAGLLIPAEGTSERLADELVAVLETPERYARMREAAREVAAFQSWDRAAREFLTLLETSGFGSADPVQAAVERI
jgi:glycosyltransferase involved in cell wall biosynthesis